MEDQPYVICDELAKLDRDDVKMLSNMRNPLIQAIADRKVAFISTPATIEKRILRIPE